MIASLAWAAAFVYVSFECSDATFKLDVGTIFLEVPKLGLIPFVQLCSCTAGVWF